MGHLYFVVLSLTIILNVSSQSTKKLELKKASQCFKSRGIPKVAFDCPQNHMIKIHRAFHGIAVKDRSLIPDNPNDRCEPSPGHISNNCTMCDGDCIDDSMNMVYDWSTCMGNTSCLRTVMQSYMPACPGHDKFSDYLQVEYQCVPRVRVINICSHLEKTLEDGYIMSPNYPHNYPTDQDCLCRLYTDWSSRIVLSLYDLLLETKNGRCRADWLMLRQKEQKHRHCGAIMTGTKNLTSETNSIEIQFHSDENDNRTQNFQYFTRSLKGFWLYFQAKPQGTIKVACRKLTKEDHQVKEIYRDDREFEEVMTNEGDDMTTVRMPTKDKDGKKKDEMGMKEENSVGSEVSEVMENGKKMKRPGQKQRQGMEKGKEANYKDSSSGVADGSLLLPVVCFMTLTSIMLSGGSLST